MLSPLADEGRLRDDGAAAGAGAYPFAWSQLVFYHRGPDHPLGTATSAKERRAAMSAMPARRVEGAGGREVLGAGFIGRRTELHALRKRSRLGERVFVLQGLGGLGKSTLSFQSPRLPGAILAPTRT